MVVGGDMKIRVSFVILLGMCASNWCMTGPQKIFDEKESSPDRSFSLEMAEKEECPQKKYRIFVDMGDVSPEVQAEMQILIHDKMTHSGKNKGVSLHDVEESADAAADISAGCCNLSPEVKVKCRSVYLVAGMLCVALWAGFDLYFKWRTAESAA